MQKFNSSTIHQQLQVGDKQYEYYNLNRLSGHGFGDISTLPFSLKVLLENLVRFHDGESITADDIHAVIDWRNGKAGGHQISYQPARVLMQDFTGVPAVVDLAAMRDSMNALGGDARKINPQVPVDLVIDHSVDVDAYAEGDAYEKNVEREMQRNKERYQFLRWGKQSFDNFHVVPPGTGICHQVNLEYLGQVVFQKQDGDKTWAYPDTLVGTDSHTTMINGLGILGWGVGGIEAEAAMLGQPVVMLVPDVVGFRLEGKLQEGVTATDLVLTVTQMLREKGVVTKFVEFYGPGLDYLPLADRATISNMTPEFGATCGFFPIDKETIKYLQLTNRDAESIALVESYAKEQGLWRDSSTPDPIFNDTIKLDLATVEPSLAGPKLPQERVSLSGLPVALHKYIKERDIKPVPEEGLQHGDVVIAAITSCTNTSNPSVLMAAGLVAKNAIEKGLKVKPWVKTSLAPGSKVVTDYLKAAGLQSHLDQLGFNLVAYGCTTCIGNSGPLDMDIAKEIDSKHLATAAVLSGNRNFEGRVHPQVRTSWLASPPLVVAYALAGTVDIDLSKDAIGEDQNGQAVFLKDIWPSNHDIADAVTKVSQSMYSKEYAEVFNGTDAWRALPVTESDTYNWQNDSSYIQHPPFFKDMSVEASNTSSVENARVLMLLGDSITTDHISPAGKIDPDSAAGKYLQSKGIQPNDFNSYGSRRGNHEVMMRGTFGNTRIHNEMLSGTEGSFTKHLPTGEKMTVYDAAMKYQEENTPLVVIAGKLYGAGSSRDWAAKGTLLLGVKAVIAESYERIHRSNLIGMGVLPLQFIEGESRQTKQFDGSEQFTIHLDDSLQAGANVEVTVTRSDGKTESMQALCRIDTVQELAYYKHGGILQYVLRKLK